MVFMNLKYYKYNNIDSRELESHIVFKVIFNTLRVYFHTGKEVSLLRG